MLPCRQYSIILQQIVWNFLNRLDKTMTIRCVTSLFRLIPDHITKKSILKKHLRFHQIIFSNIPNLPIILLFSFHSLILESYNRFLANSKVQRSSNKIKSSFIVFNWSHKFNIYCLGKICDRYSKSLAPIFLKSDDEIFFHYFWFHFKNEIKK